jgi:hypothetical protein
LLGSAKVIIDNDSIKQIAPKSAEFVNILKSNISIDEFIESL